MIAGLIDGCLPENLRHAQDYCGRRVGTKATVKTLQRLNHVSDARQEKVEAVSKSWIRHWRIKLVIDNV